eukprot:6203920-Pleurochrysis_carterae.AAC.1
MDAYEGFACASACARAGTVKRYGLAADVVILLNGLRDTLENEDAAGGQTRSGLNCLRFGFTCSSFRSLLE